MAQFEQLSGLAGDIRTSITSEQYDLGGYTEQRARDLMLAAFTNPLTAPTEMVKFTFIVGGGKLVRSRYSDDLPKWLNAALREIGFTEDRSAAETFDSQGTYKQQHDTGQNLKYLIVYPRVACASAGAKKADSGSAEVALDQNAPEYIVVACERATLPDIVAHKVTSYNQKKRLLKFLQEKHEEFKVLEAKLVTGALLSPQEQAIYDANSGSDEEKITWLQNAIKEMVDQGEVTAREKTEILKNIEQNLANLHTEIEAAKAENKPKKVEKLEEKKAAALTRKAFVEKIAAIPPRLRHGEDIRKLYMKLFPLQVLEDKGRSMSLTLQDLKLLEPKVDIENEIKELENESRGWFEVDEDFTERCQYEEKEARAAYKKKVESAKKSSSSGGAKNGTTSKVGSSSGWATVTKKPAGSSQSKPAAKKATTGFAAAFDDDSD